MRRNREDLGWSQGELAQRMRDAGWANFHQTTISRIEKGDRPIRLGEAQAIAQLLETSVDAMLQPPEEAALTQQMMEAVGAVHGAYSHIHRSTSSLLRGQTRLRELLADPVVDAALEDLDTAGQDDDRLAVIQSFRQLVERANEAMELLPEQAVATMRDELAIRRPAAVTETISMPREQLRKLVRDLMALPDAERQRIIGELSTAEVGGGIGSVVRVVNFSGTDDGGPSLDAFFAQPADDEDGDDA